MTDEEKSGGRYINQQAWQDNDFLNMSREELELFAMDPTGAEWGTMVTAAARAELHHRDVEERRTFDDAVSRREVQRKQHEDGLQKKQQDFQTALVDKQLETADRLAMVQNETAASAARAAKYAAGAAAGLFIIAAVQMIVQLKLI